MIVIAHKHAASLDGSWQEGFLRMLPAIERDARIAFRGLRGDAKDDAICEVVASAFCAYRRLYERKELQRAFASALARFAVSAYFRGRRVGVKQVSSDLFCARQQRRLKGEICHIGTPADQRAEWMERLVDNRRTPVPEQVHFRVEFPRWLSMQSPRNRQIAQQLLMEHSTEEVARQFKVSPGRISQLRREFYDSWYEFCGEKSLAA